MNKLEGKNPFTLDSREPSKDVRDFINGETRYTSLHRTAPDAAKEYREKMAEFVKERYASYRRFAGLDK